MKLPKLDWALAVHWPHNEIIIGAMNLGRELDSAEAAEVIRRVELHDELVEALEGLYTASSNYDYAADDTLSLLLAAEKQAGAILAKSKGA